MLAAAICECSSTIPDVKCLPVASTILALDDFNPFPTAEILPFLTNTSVLTKYLQFRWSKQLHF